MEKRKRFKKLGIIFGILLCIALAGGALLYWIHPQWLPFSKPALSAVNLDLNRPDGAITLSQKTGLVTAQELEAAIQNNYNENFQTSFRAEAAYVVDEKGEVVYAKNEHTRLYPASTTKMMTAYLAVTHTEDLDQLVTLAPLEGCYEDGSLILYLEEGDQITMRDLLNALLLCSYNDAATAIAMEVGGSLEQFSELMNQQLDQIGAEESHFVTPHGLHNDNHYTTAHDLNLILQMAWQNEEIQNIMMTPKATITVIRDGEPIEYDLPNTSFYIRGSYQVPSMTYVGGKTGYTQKAGSCLASVFEQDDKRYFSTIMKSEDASYMTAILMDYYFCPEALPSFSKTVPLMRDNA